MNAQTFAETLAKAKADKAAFSDMRKAVEAAPDTSNGTAWRDELLAVPEMLSPRLNWIHAMKEEYRIFTHYAENWLAIPMNIACKKLEGYNLTDEEKTDGATLMAGYCRLLDDANILTDGHATEEDAIVALAKANGWRLWFEL